MDTRQIAFAVGVSLAGLHVAVAAVLFYKRRELHPIRRRSVPLVLLAAVSVVLNGAHLLLECSARSLFSSDIGGHVIPAEA